MRIPLTRPNRRRRWLAATAAGAAAAVAVATVAFAPAALAGGPDGTLCKMSTSRVQIPSNFTVSACFNGQVLYLSNRTSAVLRVYSAGDIGQSSRLPATPDPSISTLLTTLITEGDTIPPGTEMQLPIGSGTADIQIEVNTQANRTYDLYALLLSYLPGADSYEDVAAAEESFSADFTNAETCESHATNWLGKIGCVAGLDANLQFASTKLALQVGIDVPGALVKALISTVWDGWDQMGQSNDLNTIAASTPTLHIAAAAGTSPQGGSTASSSTSGSGGGAAAGTASATASSSNGQLTVQLANFPLGTTYYFCHSGSGYPTGGAIAGNGSVSVTSPDENLGALCSGSGNFWIGFQATDGHDYYSNQVTLGATQSTPVTPAPYDTGRQVSIAPNATTGVSGHTGPGNQYAAGPSHPANSALRIVCYENGQTITNSYYNDTTPVWDLSDDGYWYSDAWLYTGTNGAAVPLCALKTVKIAPNATTGVSGHTGPGNQYAAGPAYSANSPITIACYVNGQTITNSYYNDTTAIWDLATDGRYYSDAWLYTGTNGAAVPACP